MGSDRLRHRTRQAVWISIHAPAWGATHCRRFAAYSDHISIHAPAWGATGAVTRTLSDGAFQSTLPRGERPKFVPPGWEREDFNPRSRVGSDKKGVNLASILWNFNPRSRVGSDYISKQFDYRADDFNPRSRVGSDSKNYWICLIGIGRYCNKFINKSKTAIYKTLKYS